MQRLGSRLDGIFLIHPTPAFRCSRNHSNDLKMPPSSFDWCAAPPLAGPSSSAPLVCVERKDVTTYKILSVPANHILRIPRQGRRLGGRACRAMRLAWDSSSWTPSRGTDGGITTRKNLHVTGHGLGWVKGLTGCISSTKDSTTTGGSPCSGLHNAAPSSKGWSTATCPAGPPIDIYHRDVWTPGSRRSAI